MGAGYLNAENHATQSENYRNGGAVDTVTVIDDPASVSDGFYTSPRNVRTLTATGLSIHSTLIWKLNVLRTTGAVLRDSCVLDTHEKISLCLFISSQSVDGVQTSAPIPPLPFVPSPLNPSPSINQCTNLRHRYIAPATT